jgi:Acetyltransferases, including N-acetylases of ribosomal proteins
VTVTDLEIFSGPPVYLLPFDRCHIPAALEWFHTDEDVLRYLTWQGPNTPTTEEGWFQAMQASSSDYVFAVIDAESGRHIGNTGLHDIDPADRRGEVGIYLAPEGRDRGYGAAALTKLLTWAFDIMNLHRAGLRVWSYNERAIRTYERIGFVREGTLREAHFFQGRYWDTPV